MTHILHITRIFPGDKELDKPVSQREIINTCRNLKNGKSCGVDGILNEMINYGQSVLIPCLLKLFNFILSSGIILEFGQNDTLYPFIKLQTQLIPIIIGV